MAETTVYSRDYKSSAWLADLAYAAGRLRAGATPQAIRQAVIDTGRSLGNDVNALQSISEGFTVVASTGDASYNFKSGLKAVVLQDQSYRRYLVVAGVEFPPGSRTLDTEQTISRTTLYGFNDLQYADLRVLITNHLQSNGQPIFLIGHSLGGQLARVAFADFSLQGRGNEIASVVTFSPYGINQSASLFKPNGSLGTTPAVANYLQILQQLRGNDDYRMLSFSVNGDWVPLALAGLSHPGNNQIVDAETIRLFPFSHFMGDFPNILGLQKNNQAPLGYVRDLISSLPGGADPGLISLLNSGYGSFVIGDDVGGLTTLSLDLAKIGIGQWPYSMIDLTESNEPSLPVGIVRTSDGLLVDGNRRRVEIVLNSAGQIVATRAQDGPLAIEVSYDSFGNRTGTSIQRTDTLASQLFASAGGALGDALGYYIADGDFLTGIVASATLRTVGQNLGEFVSDLAHGASASGAAADIAESFGPELLANLQAAGAAGISSFITAEIVNAVGLDGIAGDAAQAALNAYLTPIINNLPGLLAPVGSANHVTLSEVLDGVNPAVIAATFIGSKIANEIYSPETVGGQIGGATGSGIGAFVASKIFLANPTPAGFVAAVAAFVAIKIAGALIGSIFGGTPRSGADVTWDPVSGTFEVANAYARKGGSKDAAVGVASAVADTFNTVLALTGGKLISPENIQTGNYGLRKKDYVYRSSSTRDNDAITKRFSGKEGAERLIGYGVHQGLTDPDFQVAGGDVFAKRALYNTFELGGVDVNDFDTSMLLGNLATAKRYQTYLANSTSINALIAAEPDSVFTAEWALILSRAVELGLTRRHQSDWYGGFGLLMHESGVTPDHVNFTFDHDPLANRFSRLIGLGEYVIGDAIDIAAQDVIVGTSEADNIRLSGTALSAPTTTENVNLTLNGAAFNGPAFTIGVAAFVDAGDGDDYVYGSDRGDNILGGGGNDRLIGGKLDDWLIGGDGVDYLYAGAVDPATATHEQRMNADGGNGNYLDGGAGADNLYGSKGSDWLVGGDGVDDLYAGAGGDILDAGRGDDDDIKGNGGSDQYVFRRGDGQDTYYDHEELTEPSTTSTDPISVRVIARNNGTTAKSWAGDGEFTVDGSTKGGEDAIVFGEGITLKHLIIERGTKTEPDGSIVPNNNLIIRVQELDGITWNVGGDQITIRNWFNGTRKIEWLRFSNGDELRIGDIVGFLKGTSGNDVIVGTSGKDFIYGLEGDDRLFGLANNDFVSGGLGNDLVSGNDDDDMVLGGQDDDVVLGGLGQDFVTGDGGNDRIYGGANADIISGGRGDDSIVTGGGADLVKYSRGDGRDTLFDEYAGTWETVWQNGAYINGYSVDGFGNVSKNGVPIGTVAWDGHWDYNEQNGAKSLRRLIEPASGPKTLDSGSSDSVEFDVGIDPDDIVFKREGDDLRVAITAPGTADSSFEGIADQIRLKEWFVTPTRGIEHLSFIAVGKIDISEATSGRVVVGGTDGNESLATNPGIAAWITGGVGDDTITGSTKDDILNGNGGADTVRGDAGVDVLYGGGGDDVLEGGAGADMLFGGSGADTASYTNAVGPVRLFIDNAHASYRTGDAQGDTYEAIENLTGSSYADYIVGDAGDSGFDGGGGDDTIHGGAGDDSYELGNGSGADTIIDKRFEPAQVQGPDGTITGFTAGDAGSDTLEIGTGLSLSNLGFVRNGNDLEVRLGASDRSIIKDFYVGNDSKVETLLLADGLAVNLAAIRLPSEAATTEGNLEDFMVGDAGANVLSGLAGNDAVSGGGGDDQLSGGDGDDVLEGGAGADRLDGGADSTVAPPAQGGEAYGDTIRYASSAGAISINLATSLASGGDAAGDVLIGIENVVGSGLADTLTGDDRANRLFGLDGNDTINGLGGDDVVVGAGGDDSLDGGVGHDNLSGGLGLDTLRGGDGDDILDGGDGGDQLYGGAGRDKLVGGAGDDAMLEGGDGDDALTGGDGSDRLEGGIGKDILDGGDGNDTLVGGDSSDTLEGGAGVDSLHGGAGDDSYLFDPASGSDTVDDRGGANRILMKGVTPEQVWLTRAGNDLKVAIIGATSMITVRDYFAGTSPSLVREIATGNHSLFLQHAGGLINAMTAAVMPASISAMPAIIAETSRGLWWAGGKAVPLVSSQNVGTTEDVPLSGTINAVDHDGNITGYAIAQAAARGTLALNSSTGAWIYTPETNYSGNDSFSISVTDADGHVANAIVNVTVGATNDQPVFAATQPALAVDENAAINTVIATLSASDPEGQTVYFSIADSNSPFKITSGGALSVRDNLQLNYESASSISVTVQITDGTTTPVDRPFSVTIRNLNEKPYQPAVDGTPLVRASEGSLGGTVIANFVLSDPDVGSTLSLRPSSGSPPMFATSGTNLVFAAGYTPDYETIAVAQPWFDRDNDGLREIDLVALVETFDGVLDSDDKAITLSIEDVNEAPTNVAYTASIPSTVERDHPHSSTPVPPPAILLATLTTTDPDLAGPTGESHLYSVSDSRFDIVNGNQLVLKQGAVLDYETALIEAGTGRRYVQIAVTSRDRGGTGLWVTRTLQVTVNDSDDYYYGGLGNDTITGEAGRDIMFGSGGNDALSGAAGNDELSGEAGVDTLRGGIGNDTLYGGTEGDTLYGDEGDDAVHGNDGGDRLEGGSGADQLFGHSEDDQLYGGDGADTLEGGFGNDYLDGGSDAAADILRGDSGNDTLLGAAGNDSLDGGEGNDTLNGGAGADELVGGAGLEVDTASYTTSAVGVGVYLANNALNANGDAAGDTLTRIENLVGSAHADTLVGDANSNWIEGGAGGDWLQGESGHDGLYGQSGDDNLHGMEGRDTLEGGADNDTLQGHAGDDILRGGTGNDSLIGGSGSDAYMFVRGDGYDTVDQTGSLTSDNDVVGFEGLNRQSLWFRWDTNHLMIDVLGGSALDGSVKLKDFKTADVDQRANIRTVLADIDQTVELKLGEFATALVKFSDAHGYTPTTQNQLQAFRNNTTLLIDGRTFEQTWTNYWTSNEAPSISFGDSAHLSSGFNEDTAARTLTFAVTEPNLIEFWAKTVATEGSTAEAGGPVGVSHTSIGVAGGSGTITATPLLNKSGETWLWLHAKDAGGLVSDRWVRVFVSPVADPPSVTASSGGGNAGAEIAISVTTQLADTDSEYISAVEISNVPDGFSFKDAANSISAGANNLGGGRWRFFQTQLQGLKINAPVGWSQNLSGASALSVIAFSQENSGGAPAQSAPAGLSVNINVAPTAISLSKADIDENSPIGTPVGVLQGNDPDRLENNPFDLATASIIDAESRWIHNTPGPLGGTVTALQTGQFNNESGGGAFSPQFTVDPTKTYKFTVYVRADSSANTLVYFGLSQGGYVEHAATGADEGNPYFMYPVQNSLTPGRWYRFEGYVLPQDSPYVPDGIFGGVFDTVTGQKVGGAVTYRWNNAMPNNSVHGRFFDYYGSPQGFATSWYQPVVEQVPTFLHLSGSGFSVDGATGLVRLATSPNYEATSSLPLQVRASDAGGLTLDGNLTVVVNNVNEPPNAPTGGGAREYFSETGLGGRPANANAVVATYGLSDADGAAPSLVLTGNPNGWFRVVGNQVLINSGLNFDFEWARNVGYVIGDRNGNGIQDALVATIGVAASDGVNPLSPTVYTEFLIEDVEEDPVNLAADRILTFAESTGAGEIAWFRATDPDADGPINYAIADSIDGGGRFSVRSDGLLSTTGVALDYENATSYTIRVVATDTGGRSITDNFVIQVTNVNENPSYLGITSQAYHPETTGGPSHAGQVIATLNLSDPDTVAGFNAPRLVILAGNDHGWFQETNGNQLAFTSANFTADWLHAYMGQHGVEATYAHDKDGDGIPEVRVATLTLAAQDAGGLRSDQFTYSVFIEDANEVPSISTNAFAAVPENAPGAGITAVGTLAWTDPDAAAAFRNPRFAITGGNDGNLFSVDPVTGVVSLQGSLNYEGTTEHNLSFSITDAAGLATTKSVAVPVTNVNEAPQPTGYGSHLSTPPPSGWMVGDIDHNDPDANDTVSFELESSPYSYNYRYRYHVTGTGQIQIYPTGNNYSNATYFTDNLLVRVRDAAGLSNTVTIPIYHGFYIYPPVVLDLDGDGIELTSVVNSPVRFDIDHDGIKDQTGWVGADDGLLVLDRNASGTIDNPNEFQFAIDLAGAESDLQGLRAYDSNENGYFDKGDREFHRFQVWKDANQDGTSQADELKSLSHWGIASIDLSGVETGQVVEGATDNVLFAISKFYRTNGSSGNVGDAFFAFYSGADSDKKGKSKFGSKVKFAGVDNSKALPEKLKKKIDGIGASAVKAKGDDDDERKLAGKDRSKKAGKDDAPGLGDTDSETDQAAPNNILLAEVSMSDAADVLPAAAAPIEKGGDHPVGSAATLPFTAHRPEHRPTSAMRDPQALADDKTTSEVADEVVELPNVEPDRFALSENGSGSKVQASDAREGDREAREGDREERREISTRTGLAWTGIKFVDPLDKAIALLQENDRASTFTPASFPLATLGYGTGYGANIRAEEFLGDVALDRLVAAMAALQSGENVGSAHLRPVSVAEGTLLTLAASS